MLLKAQRSFAVTETIDVLQALKWVTMEECEAINREHPSCIRKAKQIVACNEVRNFGGRILVDGRFLVIAYVHSEYKNLWYLTKVWFDAQPGAWHYTCTCKQRYGHSVAHFRSSKLCFD